jgi:hypothetical protein
MPARKKAPIFCACAACCRYSGHSKGVAFPSMIERTAHLARVNLERDAMDTTAPTQPTEIRVTEEDIHAAGAEVFVSTFLDNGPNLDNQPPRLWTSRNEFQQHIISTDSPPDASSSISINDIIDGVSRLTLSPGVQDLPSSTAQSHISSPTHFSSSSVHNPPISSSECSTITQSRLPSPTHFLTPSSQRSLEKRSCHRKSQQAVQLLKNMSQRLSAVQQKLLTPSHEILCEAELDMVAVRKALEKVTRRTESVDSQKHAVLQTLDGLHAQVTELRNVIPDTRHNPVEFDSSKGCDKFDHSQF